MVQSSTSLSSGVYSGPMGTRGCSFSTNIIHPRAFTLYMLTFPLFFWFSELIRTTCEFALRHTSPTCLHFFNFYLHHIHIYTEELIARAVFLFTYAFSARTCSFIHFFFNCSLYHIYLGIRDSLVACLFRILAFPSFFLASYVFFAFYSGLVFN